MRAGSRTTASTRSPRRSARSPSGCPRFRCAGCGATEAGVGWPPHVRSTLELDRLRAQLSALMTYRTAAEVLAQMFPVDAGADPETLRRHTFKTAEELPTQAATKPPPTGAEAIVVTLASTFIRSCEAGERHLEVRIGNAETTTGRRQVFGAVAKAETDLGALIRRGLDAVGRTEGTALTAFTDGCPGLRRILLRSEEHTSELQSRQYLVCRLLL